MHGIRRPGIRLLLLAATLALLGPALPLGAQEAGTGRIVGRVLDAESAEPLRSAQVHLSGGSVGGLSSLDGRYVLVDVPAGTHDLQVQLLGFGTKTVTGVRVEAGRTTVLDIRISPQVLALDGITVSAAAERGSTTALTTERRLASVVSDAIGRDQMARSPDGDAAAALKRVPGLSVVDGKFAYVRGLGERYSSTTLNDAPLASPVPDRKVIPLDLFPSGFLESIVTAKSFSPEEPGDFTGGLVKLRTRDFPPEQTLKVSVGTSWNSVATFADGLTYESGGGLDLLGIDDGARSLPSAVPETTRVSSSNFSSGEIQTIGRSFGGDWGPRPMAVPVNTSVGLTYGNDVDLGDDERLGFVGSFTYSSSYDVRDDQVERVFAQSGVDDPEVDYRVDQTTRSIDWGGLLNVTYQPNGGHQVALSAIHNRMTDDLARRLEGFNLDSNTDQLNTRLQYVSTAMSNVQLRGEHALGERSGATIDWRTAYTRADRYEPNTREVLYRKFEDTYYFDDFIQSGSIFHQDQTDAGWNGGANLVLPFELADHDVRVRAGVSSSRKDRDTYTRRFRFRPFRGGDLTNEHLASSPNDLFVPENIGPSALQLEEATFREDNYDASEAIDAAYLTVDTRVLSRLRVAGGARIESARQAVDPLDLFVTGMEPAVGAELDDTDVMPALNLTFEATDAMNLRASVSRTVARPQLRELAPFSFADYAGGYLVSGNPSLQSSGITNFDVRWEWFSGATGVVAVSGFYKRFEDPIEVLVLPSTELVRSWVNVPEARNFGAEIEVRSDLGFLGAGLEPLQLDANLTLVESEVDAGGTSTVFIPGQGPVELRTVDRARPLQGQSPYVVNAGLTWFDAGSGRSASVLFNRFGRRIDAVGREASPDILEEPRSQLDLVVQRPVRDFSVKLAFERLIGNEVRFTQGGESLRLYDLGRSVSLSVSWSAIGR